MATIKLHCADTLLVLSVFDWFFVFSTSAPVSVTLEAVICLFVVCLTGGEKAEGGSLLSGLTS